MRIRPAHRDDLHALRVIAADGGSPDGDERYFRYLAEHGRLLVADVGDVDVGDVDVGDVVGFAGSIAVDDATMVTDMFVSSTHRGRGLGSSLLGAVTEGSGTVVTFSSTHPAALALYRAAGLEPQWDLLTLRGTATGGGPELSSGTWRHGRADVVDHFRDLGAVVGADHVVLPATAHEGGVNVVWRLVSDHPAVDAARLLAALPTGAPVEWSLPEPHPLSTWLLDHGFAVIDRDVCCSSVGWNLGERVCSVHRGLL